MASLMLSFNLFYHLGHLFPNLISSVVIVLIFRL